MNYNQLLRSELSISELGFGCWGLGSDSYGNIEESKSIDLLNFALDLGFNFFDTSSLYGNRISEKRIGKFIKSNKQKNIILSTKAGLLPHKPFQMKRNFKKNHIEQSLEKSLRLLNKNVDIFFLHSPRPIDIIHNDELLNFLANKKKKGDIRLIGVSADSPFDIQEIIQHSDFDIVQTNFNLMDQRIIELDLLNFLNKKKINIIARTPLAFGFLSGKIKYKDLKKKNDHRKYWSSEQIKIWEQGYKKFNVIRKKYRQSPSQFALNFCKSFNEIQTVIPGMMNRLDVIENFIVSEMKNIDRKDLKDIHRIYKRNNFFIR